MVIISPTMYAPDIQGMSHIAEVVKECHIAEVVVYLRQFHQVIRFCIKEGVYKYVVIFLSTYNRVSQVYLKIYIYQGN